MPELRKTKIICTLGPSVDDEETLRQLILAGMNAARFNFSHGTHESQLATLQKLKRVRDELGRPVATILDTKGPEIRIKAFRDGPVSLERGAPFILTTEEVEGDAGRVSVTYQNLANEVEPGCHILVDDGLVDLLIPRGGAGLIRACVEQATVPCIQTGTGICHVYVDEYADLDKAVKIIVNAKTSRPSVCNAEEVCLVHSAVAERFLPMLRKALVEDRTAAGQIPVELRLDPRAAAVIPGTPAGPADFDTEFLDYILAVRVVDSVDEAIEHIQAHSTHHSEAIVTENDANAEKFVNGVDSAAVYVNVSTRFTDGGEFGLGCEMGISTQKLHARGPMGLDELSTYQYIIRGSGQTR